ncbi:ferric reductase-like transmembrane domain-containing protein [Ancylobacter sp. MQZ15Z-1]|uniref:Protein-methionine-sulfoxide reductase heme-binding subunit MsrQ n=1 Tax=Ancylobacter mangrovi TaxID=2972472 RepID=A0A9X2T5Q3_9HYPH|nr:ferric reductase-like transmembrane domain-containing protein [Ancylobacter mangrovi]MCS0497526.1 ferric reductase-like transmembrane domain-containing protein [Ancylobacter mangrovi]
MHFLRERNGRLSPEKIVALLIVLYPLALLIARALSGGFTTLEPFGIGAPGAGGPGLGAPGLGGPGLGTPGLDGPGPALSARPLVEVIRVIGDWTIRLLLITLAITPARRLFNWPKLLAARRTLGVGAAFYIAVHFSFYLIDTGSLTTAAREIVLRIYLTIGFVALVGLMVLAATSWDGAIRRLGAERWARLHMLVYPIVALGLLHFFMQQKLDVTEPTLMAGFFLWLMGWRLMQRAGRGTGFVNLVALALLAGLATALLEAGWYLAATGVDPVRVLAANLDFGYSLRPAWWVAATGLAIAVASSVVLRWRPLPAPRARTARA